MSDNFESSLINLGELSKPATVLVEKISDAVGGIFKPYQMVRVAKAEAQADRIRAEGQIEISDLQRRAFHRFLEEEAKKQKNIEDVTQNALPLLTEDSKPNEVEDDWITHFFDRCRLVSDVEMQSLWSKVLAGEANSPGRYSKRTVNFLSGLDKSEAELFKQLCDFCWTMEDELVVVIFDVKHKIYNDHDIDFDALIHLESIGLVQYFPTDEVQRLGMPASITASYFGATLRADTIHGDLDIGHVVLTKVGQELAPICGSEPVEGFVEYTSEKWRERKQSQQKAPAVSSKAKR